MNMDMSAKTKIYRHKFSPKFLEYLKDFSRIHRYDTAAAFKDNWEIWCDENKDIIEEERKKLKEQGYDGKVLVKMYKSARYYFKTKSNRKTEPVKRRNYIGLDSEFRDLMDNHIENVCARREMKPADGFVDFMDQVIYVDKINTETIRLKSYNFKQEEIFAKMKKTYKNRYFIYQKSN
tara:strand:- start:15631 stop:16164 length:534 start_codon:yes stop_codon:yes gene_type:complete